MKAGTFCAIGLSFLLLPAWASAAPPARVVSIGGHVTEIVYALGAQGALVGTDSSSIYPEEAKKLPQVGYLRQVAVEGVASLQPDLIVASYDIGPPAALEKIRALGVPLVVTSQTDTIAEAATRIREVGKAVGFEDQAEALATRVQREAEDESNRLNALPGKRPRVALFLGHGNGSPMAAGVDTGGDAMIRLAGGDNAFSGMKGFKAVSAEALMQAAPEVIVLTQQSVTQAGSLDAVVKSMKGVEHTPAGQAQRFVVMDVMELFAFGPRLSQALRALGKGIHGESMPTTERLF